MNAVDAQALDQAWQEVLEAWEDDQKHRRFLELCRIAGQLSEAGRRYREVREGDPARAEIAAEQIDRLLNVAMQTMQVHRTPARAQSRAWLWVGLAATVGLLALWWQQMSQRLP